MQQRAAEKECEWLKMGSIPKSCGGITNPPDEITKTAGVLSRFACHAQLPFPAFAPTKE